MRESETIRSSRTAAAQRCLGFTVPLVITLTGDRGPTK